MAIKINLTDERLKVNKWECDSVTVCKLEDGTFEAHLMRIKGVTKDIPIMYKFTEKQKTRWDGTKVFRTSKGKKVIRSKTFEYSGIELKEQRHYKDNEKYFFATNGAKSNYINYYELLDIIVSQQENNSQQPRESHKRLNISCKEGTGEKRGAITNGEMESSPAIISQSPVDTLVSNDGGEE